VEDAKLADWVQSALERFEKPLMRYAAHLTGSVETAQDVVQDTFLKLCSADRHKVGNHLGPWLYTVCRNRALDVRRKERRMMPLTEGVRDRLENSRPATAGLPSDAADLHERASRVMQALGGLTRNQQEVIRLKFQNALSYREISEVTGLSVSNVGYLIHMGLRQMRQQLGVAAPRAGEALGGQS